MKKLLSCSLLLAGCVLSFVACNDRNPEPPFVDTTDHGKVYLTPEHVTLAYGETDTIVPSFSSTGDALNKAYKWSLSDKGVVEMNVTTANEAVVKARRAGVSVVRIYSTDGKIYAESTVSVETQTNLLNHVLLLFRPGSTMAYVKQMVPEGTLNEKESTEEKLVYDLPDNAKIEQEIHYFEQGGLVSTLVILRDDEEALKEAEMYIKERFEDLNLATADNVRYYDMGVYQDRYKDQVVGIFLSSSDTPLIPEGIKGKTGVKFTTRSRIEKK